MPEQNKMPVTIIGGYLGSGKTTLVNHLLRNADGKRLAIMVNEFGELPIDADLIEAQDDDIISLSGGCVCCSYGNDLIMAMMDMAKMDPRPDHIVLEASGVALPGAIANSLSLLNDYSLDGIVVLTDVETIRERAGDKYMSDTVLRQLEDADIVLMNKADLVSDNISGDVSSWLAEKSPGAQIIKTERSVVHPTLMLQDFERQPVSGLGMKHHDAGQFNTELVVPDGPVDACQMANDLIENTPGLVRAKGFVKSINGTMQTIQIVGKRAEITPAPEGAEVGVITISVGG